jgi:hypothetical protein
MSFKENFEREENEKLTYDDTAFYYFAFATLFFALVPCTYYLVMKPMLVGEKIINLSIKNCQCQMCLRRMKARQAVHRFSYLNKWLVGKILVISFCWLLCFQSYVIVKDLQEIKGFVPHEILDI